MWKVFGKENTADTQRMEDFVKSHPNSHFLQSPRWAQVKTCWDWRGILVYRQEQLVGVMSLLIRPLPLGYSLFYAPRGPVCDRNDPWILEELLSAVKDTAKKHRAVLLYLDPDEPDSNQAFRSILTGLGFREKSDNGFGNIQAQHVFRLDLAGSTEAELFDAFSPKTRYNIRLAQRKGVTIREFSGAEPIPETVIKSFSGLMDETGQRDHFQTRSADYFSGVLRAMQGDARLFMAYYQEEPIAGTIEVFCGNKAWYLYGASSNRHRGTMPNYLLQWTMIRRAVDRGCALYDFRGVPGDPSPDGPLYGLYRFKKGFSGTYIKFSGLFSLSFRPLLSAVFCCLRELRQHKPRAKALRSPGLKKEHFQHD